MNVFVGWCGRCGLQYRDVDDWLERGHHGCDPRPVELDQARAERDAWRAILAEEDERRHSPEGGPHRGERAG